MARERMAVTYPPIDDSAEALSNAAHPPLIPPFRRGKRRRAFDAGRPPPDLGNDDGLRPYAVSIFA
jgi:hypothetical protein